MGRYDHLVKNLFGAISGCNDRTVRGTPHTPDCTIHYNATPKTLEKGLNVRMRPSRDRIPLGVPLDREQPVIKKKPCKGLHGKIEHLHVRGGPYRCRDRQEIVLDKFLIKPVRLEVFTHGKPAQPPLFEQPGGDAVKGQYPHEHSPERRTDDIDPLGKERIDVLAAILQTGLFMVIAERHGAFLSGNPQLLKKRDEVRIGFFIKHNEPGINSRPGINAVFYDNGMGMPPYIVILFIERDRISPLQQIRGNNACNPCPDNGDPFDHRILHKSAPSLSKDKPYACQSNITIFFLPKYSGELRNQHSVFLPDTPVHRRHHLREHACMVKKPIRTMYYLRINSSRLVGEPAGSLRGCGEFHFDSRGLEE